MTEDRQARSRYKESSPIAVKLAESASIEQECERKTKTASNSDHLYNLLFEIAPQYECAIFYAIIVGIISGTQTGLVLK